MPAVMNSTDGLPVKSASDFWQNLICDTFVQLDCVLDGARPLRGTVTSLDAGSVWFTKVDTTSQTVFRTRSSIRRDAAEFLLVSFQLSGHARIEQDDRVVHLQPGNFTIYDSTRPYNLSFDTDFCQLVTHMPKSLLKGRLNTVDKITATKIDGASISTQIAADFWRRISASLDAIGDDTAPRLGGIATDLISSSIAEFCGEQFLQKTWASETLLRRARREFDNRLQDADLSTTVVAKDIGISPRRLQEIFASEGSSPSAYLWMRRLETASKRLRDPAWSTASITEIAYSCGFSDSAHFSHRFRERFDCSPSEWRKLPAAGQEK